MKNGKFEPLTNASLKHVFGGISTVGASKNIKTEYGEPVHIGNGVMYTPKRLLVGSWSGDTADSKGNITGYDGYREWWTAWV